MFLGNHITLIELMNTMQSHQLFDNGEYLVIYVDMETYSVTEARKYLWSKCGTYLLYTLLNSKLLLGNKIVVILYLV